MTLKISSQVQMYAMEHYPVVDDSAKASFMTIFPELFYVSQLGNTDLLTLLPFDTGSCTCTATPLQKNILRVHV